MFVYRPQLGNIKISIPKNYSLACTGEILSTCAVLQDAFAPAQFERARSGDKDQGEPTVLNLERGVRLKAEKVRPKILEKKE